MPNETIVKGLRVLAETTEEEEEHFIPDPPSVAHFADNVGASVQCIVKSLSDAIGTILSTGGYVLVFIMAGLGFMFVMWAIRLIHLRGR